MIDVVSVRRVSQPFFAEMRHAATGEGWIVGFYDAVWTDGGRSIHGHSAFATEEEAQEEFVRLREKML